MGRGISGDETEALVQRLICLYRGADPQSQMRVAFAPRLRLEPMHHAGGDSAPAKVRVDGHMLDVEDGVAIRPDDRTHQRLAEKCKQSAAVAEPLLDVRSGCAPGAGRWGLSGDVLVEGGSLQLPHPGGISRRGALNS